MKEEELKQEFAEKYKNGGWRIINDYAGNKTMQRYDNKDELLSDLNALISEGYVEKAAYVALENILAKTEAALLAQKEISKKLEFMINNGLGFEDMINDITMPHEL